MNGFKITQTCKGEHALNRVITVYGAIVLTVGFIKEAWSRNLTWLDYVGYSVGLVVLYAPVAAVKLIRAMRGNIAEPDEQPMVTTTASPAAGGVD